MPNKKLLILGITASFFLGACSNTAPQIKQQPVQKPVKKEYAAVPPPPKKKIELKEVQDDNYSPEYMYPDDKYKKDKLAEKSKTTDEDPIEAATAAMSREECIGMIGQDKFDKYTEMFGNEAASLKRCTLLKSMQKG
ncbi:hypothetical protein [Sulfurovum riftiae]|uniref:Uncharacterized protein n=1 Tax=Sulfurovum riftiae TaxID=1630136 RepID=A0A151CG34_9BACT|nr:hypothetical protein [Sulfurovum riftiae]KYJ86476.1 hypothetical protein AS592_06625 [Sulfurovum riftiae]